MSKKKNKKKETLLAETVEMQKKTSYEPCDTKQCQSATFGRSYRNQGRNGQKR